MNKFVILLLFSLLQAPTRVLYAQCTQILNKAEDEFELGRILEIPDMLQECLATGGFSEEENIRAHKLLTLVYIFSDQESLAETSMINLLKVDPEHELDRNFDPSELFYLYEKFRVAPIFRIGTKAGANLLVPYVIGEFSTYSSDTVTKVYTSQLGFNLELSIERHFKNGVEGSAGIMFRTSKFLVEERFDKGGLNTEINDAQTWIKTPLQVRYNLNYGSRRKPIPYVLLGGSFDYLLGADFVDSSRNGGDQESVSSRDLTKQNERNRINFSGFMGAGVKLRSKTHFITVEGRYELNLRNYVNPRNRYINNENIVGLTNVSDDLSLGFISFTVGYTRSIYKPKKKKKFVK